MSTLLKIYTAIASAVKAYPSAATMLVSLAVVLGTRFGLNLTATEVTGVASAVAVLVAALTHAVTVPRTQLKDR